MNLSQIHSVYFIGIGGIGMSALARWFKHNGKAVTGYDKTATALTRQLMSEGFDIHFEDNIERVSAQIKEQKEKALVIYTPAVPQGHQELNWFKNNDFKVMKRAAVLGWITEQMPCLAVAGTHGKTTTSSMLVHLLKSCGMDCAGFLGGISTNYKTNMVLNQSDKAFAVIEADEYDRSFLSLHPQMAVVTSADADHLDIYADADNLKDSFRAFIQQIKAQGTLVIKESLQKELVNRNDLHCKTYGLESGEIQAKGLRIEDATFIFDYQDGEREIAGLRLQVPGYHNVENMLAAIALTKTLGADDEQIKAAVATYAGVKRRFEYIIKSESRVFIDDYAHHPVEIQATLKSARALYPHIKMTVVFQPHLFTRTRDFAEDFAHSLSLADEVILLPIYPAREEPLPGVSSEMLMNKMTIRQKSVVNKTDVLAILKKQQPELLITLGAGDIDQLVEPIKNVFL